MNTGIYQIINTKNNKNYIGSAFNLKRRKTEHFSKLRNNKHENPYLQRSFNKHGECFFKFEILSKCPKEYCIKLEQWFINNLNPNYNIIHTARNKFGVNRPKKLTNKVVKKIISMLNSNNQIREISKQLNISESTIQDIKQGRTWLKYFDLINVVDSYKGYDVGEKSKFSKLTEKEVLEIISKINENILLKTIAIDYKVGAAQICAIRKGRNWKHLYHLVKNKGKIKK